MSGLVSVSWKMHCIYICQHNVWQNIFLKLAYLPEYFTRTHAYAHVPPIWCSCMLLSWRVKIRCTFHVKSCTGSCWHAKGVCLSTRVAKQSICTVTYVCHEMSIHFLCIYLTWRWFLLSGTTELQSQSLAPFLGALIVHLPSCVMLLTGILRDFVDELLLGLEHSWASLLVHFLKSAVFTSFAVLCLGALCCCPCPQSVMCCQECSAGTHTELAQSQRRSGTAQPPQSHISSCIHLSLQLIVQTSCCKHFWGKLTAQFNCVQLSWFQRHLPKY